MVLVQHFGEKMGRCRRLLGFSLLMSCDSIIHLLAKKPKIAHNTMIWYISVLSIVPEPYRRAHTLFAQWYHEFMLFVAV